MYSDGTTPEEQVKQILNIAAILPGQKPDSKFRIPTRRESQLSRHDSRPETNTHQASASASMGDLIDFGEDEQTTSAKADSTLSPSQSQSTQAPSKPIQSTIRDEPAPALTQDPPGFERPQLLKDMTDGKSGGSASKDLEELRDGVGALNVSGGGASERVKRHELRRKDSETQEEDVFLDAES